MKLIENQCYFEKKKNALFSQNQISDRTICSNSLRYKNRTAFIFFLLLLLLLFFFSFRVKGDCFIIFDILLIEIRSSRLFYVFGNVGVRVFDCLNRDFGYEGLVEGKQIWEIDVNQLSFTDQCLVARKLAQQKRKLVFFFYLIPIEMITSIELNSCIESEV